MAIRRTPVTADGTVVTTHATKRLGLPRVTMLVAGVLFLLAVALSTFHALVPASDEFGLEMSVALAAFGVAFAGVGGYVAARRPAHPVGWILLAIGVAQSMSSFSTSYAWRALITEPGSLPGGMAMAWASTWLFTPVVGLLVMLLLLFPTGHLPSARWRIIPRALIPVLALEIVSAALMPGPIDGLDGIRNPLGVESLSSLLQAANGIAKGTGVVLTFVAVGSLVARVRGAHGEERQGLKWILYIAALLVLAAVLNMAMDFAGIPLHASVGYALLAAFIALPLTIGAVILRYRLYDIDVIINRTLVYGLLSVLVVGMYLAVISGLGAVLDDPARPGMSLVLMVVVTIGLLPLRDRLQRQVNRLMYGDRDDPYAVLERLGGQLETGATPEQRFADIARSLRQALRLPWVEMSVSIGTDPREIASAGTPTTAPLCLPLLYEGEELGQLVLGHRVGESSFSTADLRFLNELARQLGTALHAHRLTEETRQLSIDLQRSRERLVAAREEERRRLRRDLHDGLGPQLASVTMKAEAAREMLASFPQEAAGLLESIATESREAVSDVRRLVDGLRPPALDELGLIGALRAQADRLQGNGLTIDVGLSCDLPTLPAAVEVVAYRIAVEAMTNIRRHADASRGVVRVECEPGALVITVQDDGGGLPSGTKSGVGLHSMRERAEELGGAFAIEHAPAGGTLVTARLPIGAIEGTAT